MEILFEGLHEPKSKPYLNVKVGKKVFKKYLNYRPQHRDLFEKLVDYSGLIYTEKSQYSAILDRLDKVSAELKSIVSAEIRSELHDGEPDLNRDELVMLVSKMQHDLELLIKKYEDLQIF